jgi:hypothetical protein
MIMSNKRKTGVWMGRKLPWARRAGYQIPRSQRQGSGIQRLTVPEASARMPAWTAVPRALMRRNRGER